MYEELIKSLRDCAEVNSLSLYKRGLMKQAADAIEELQKKLAFSEQNAIKGMEMPTKCGECLLAKLSPTGESLICNYMLSRVPWDERPFDCPLIELPPHGRLIDADALKSEIAEEDDGFGHDVYTAGIHDGFALSFECIDDAPTIIPAEEGE